MPTKNTTANIHVTTALATPVKANSTLFAIITEAITMILCVGGCMILFSSVLSFEINIHFVYSIMGFPILLTLIYRSRRLQIVFIIALLIFFLTSIYLYFNSITLKQLNGIVLVNARFLSAVNERYNARILFFDPVFPPEMLKSAVKIVMNSLSIVLSILFGLIIIKRRNPLLLGIGIIIFAFCGIYLPPKLPVFALLAVLIGFISYYIMWSINSEKTAQFGKSSRVLLSANTVILPISLAIVIATSALIPTMTGANSAYNLFDTIISVVNGEGTEGFFGRSDNAQGGMGSGQIGYIDKISFKSQVHLTVKTDVSVPMFLKGFVGERYLGDKGWTSKSDPVPSEFKWIFDDMERRKTTPDTLSTRFASALYKDIVESGFTKLTTNSGALPAQISTTNIAANEEFAYAPYNIESLPFNELRKQKVNDVFDYTAFMYTFPTGESAAISPAFYDTSLYNLGALRQYVPTTATSVEIDYEYFAKRAYTKIPENINDTISKFADLAQKKYELKLLQSGNAGHDYINYGMIVSSVKDVLEETASYSLSPGNTPKGQDPIEHFLNTGKKGYCAHFATAAALILRRMNVPTRYVEGYVVTQKDYTAAMAKNTNIIEIKDTNAHSWVEVYQVGPGWIPFEVTPGYSGDSVQQQNFNVEDIAPQSSEPTVSDPRTSSEMTSSIVSSFEEVSSEAAATEEEKTSIALIILIIIATIIAALIAAVFIRWGIILIKRNFKRKQSSNQAVIELYEYCTKLLELKGYKASEHGFPQAYAKHVEDYCSLVKRGELTHVTEIALKAKFSPHETTAEELAEVIEFFVKLRAAIYQQARIWENLYWRFIKVL